MLPRGEKFNKQFFTNVVMDDLLSKIISQRPVKKCAEIIIHMDNARPHLIQEWLDSNGLQRLPHPPYSPDLAPSDFFLFGYLKMKLEGRNFESDEELFKETCSILGEIPTSVLNTVYDEWITRLQRCIELRGEYVE